MKKEIQLLFFTIIVCLTSCNNENKQLAENISMYSTTWDEIINNGKLELFDNSRFDEEITLIMSPENVVGITNVQEFYANYLTGFSNIEFTIVDVFGQGNNIMKHWNFKGTHSGDFFGIPATGKMVDIDGVTLVKMKNGKIAQEQDFMDNMTFMQQLGILSSPDNVGVVDGMYKSFATGDIPAVLEAFDANIIWNEAENFPYADGNPYKGPDAVVNGVFARLGSEWDYWNLADLELHDMANDQVLATGRYQAKYKKNGKTIDAQFAHLWTLQEGKVLSFQQYADTKQLDDVTSN